MQSHWLINKPITTSSTIAFACCHIELITIVQHHNETSLFVISGYHNVSVIPVGATNIDIQQHGYQHLKDDENYLGKENYIV